MTKYELEHLLYIGEFYLQSGTLEICDPYITDILCSCIPVDSANQSTITIRNCPTGRYMAAHEVAKDNVKESLIVYPANLDYRELNYQNFEYIGTISNSISKSVCLIDSISRNDARYCEHEIEPYASYDPKGLMDNLSSCSYPPEILHELRNYLRRCITLDSAATGKDLCKITEKSHMYWCGYRLSNIQSSHWACDAFSRLKGRRASVIHGGIIARTNSSSSLMAELMSTQVYLLRSHFGTLAIRLIMKTS